MKLDRCWYEDLEPLRHDIAAVVNVYQDISGVKREALGVLEWWRVGRGM